MSDTSPLADFLDRAGHVFSLAYQLGRAFHDEHERQGEKLKIVDETSWFRHLPAFDMFCAAVLALSEQMQNPPEGFSPVAKVLLETARVAKQIRDVMQTREGQMWQGFLSFWPDLNTVGESGRWAVKEVTKAQRAEDPFAFVDQRKARKDTRIDTTPTLPKPPSGLVEQAAQAIPEILANIHLKHDGTIPKHEGTICQPALPALVRNWLIKHYLSDPTPSQTQLTKESDLEPIVFVLFDTFADYLLANSIELLPNLDNWKNAGWIVDMSVHISPTADPNTSPVHSISRLNLPFGHHRLVGIRRTVLNTFAIPTSMSDNYRNKSEAPAAVTPTAQAVPNTKRSTERGEGRAKLIAALTKFHKYADGSCLLLEPIGNNILARLAGVSESTASDFFKKEFAGYAKYRILCRDSGGLAVSMRLLNNEVAPHELYGRRPVGEDVRNDE